ncbi:DUF4153 domain-containing protein [Nocardioides sp. SYSU D00038]|uniref:DUF4153 domain-containing protein n=1 Tax=Nocardioides sp. SYSU D00038 TaxID=2812554 RepID=UPI001967244D|nr:DUF4153 domain-containing protein [Nocardioides sp. SYSU D00038]
MSGGPAPLDPLRSIKTKLGVLVVVSVLVAATVAMVGRDAGVAPWLALPITVALALAVTQLLATGMTSPLREMTRAASRMAGGDHSVRVRTDSADEVGELARAFNAMAAELGEVDQRRRDLVATVSHELRTPLTGLIAVLENLEDGVVPPDGAGLRTALTQAERLSALVSDLLDLSRLEAAETLTGESVEVAGLLATAVDEARSLARPVDYDVVVTPPGLTVVAEPARLHQLVANLLDNASRHSPAGGRVSVRASGDDDTWVLEVADRGEGIAPEDRERIFARFGSLGDERTGGAGSGTAGGTGGGTGLGLAIARWVADLHGGTIAAVDPRPGEPGARLRAVLPVRPSTPRAEEAAVPAPTAPPPSPPTPPTPPTTPAPVGAPYPSLLSTTGRLAWRTDLAGRPWLLAAAALVGLLAALVVVDNAPGLGATLVLLAGGGVWYAAHGARRDPYVVTCTVLAATLVAVLTLRDAEWISVLCALAATVLVVAASTRARSVLGLLLSGLAWPFSALVALPWLGRTLRLVAGSGRTLSVVRTLLFSLAGLVAFTLLFASADALLAEWLDEVTPSWSVDVAVARVFVGCFVGGVVLATAFFALNPPQVEAGDPAPVRPVRHRYEWLAPVLCVIGVFALFLVAQAAAVIGGDDYLQRTTGLTYAEYTHQGFGQLTFATLLTVLVVSVAARKASRETAADRLWLRGSLGVLCLLTLVVVASALRRLELYTDAYGLTRLRLLAGTFELWLAVVVIGLLVAGIRLSGPWLLRAALLSGTSMLLLLALVNPDARIAEVNVARLDDTGRIDLVYLAGLSADAVGPLRDLPPADRACVLAGVLPDEERDGFWEWNLGRWRQRDVRADLDLPGDGCLLASYD